MRNIILVILISLSLSLIAKDESKESFFIDLGFGGSYGFLSKTAIKDYEKYEEKSLTDLNKSLIPIRVFTYFSGRWALSNDFSAGVQVGFYLMQLDGFKTLFDFPVKGIIRKSIYEKLHLDGLLGYYPTLNDEFGGFEAGMKLTYHDFFIGLSTVFGRDYTTPHLDIGFEITELFKF